MKSAKIVQEPDVELAAQDRVGEGADCVKLLQFEVEVGGNGHERCECGAKSLFSAGRSFD